MDLFAATNNSGGGSMMLVILAVALGLVELIAYWKTFQKAGHPGWAAIIPIYNAYILLKMAGRPGWWLILYIIPVVNLITHLVVSIDVAKRFGKSTAFGVFGLWIFSFIGYLMLGFGDAKYKKA
jgi:hypothetical protein